MKLSVLADNNTIIDRYFLGEPGVSYYIEEGGKRILFDTGYSDVFLQNAAKLGIDICDIDYLVLSHGHNDHTWGLQHLMRYLSEQRNEHGNFKKLELIAHPDVLDRRYTEENGEIGALISKDRIIGYFNERFSKEPVWITDKLVFLGEIKRKNDFENQSPIGRKVNCKGEEDDYLMDDSALCYKGKDGLVIITGCSHSGICNIIEAAKEVCEDKRIADVFGGLHLLEPSSEVMMGTVNYILNNCVEKLHACHCTDLKSKIKLSEVAEVIEVGSGLTIEWE